MKDKEIANSLFLKLFIKSNNLTGIIDDEFYNYYEENKKHLTKCERVICDELILSFKDRDKELYKIYEASSEIKAFDEKKCKKCLDTGFIYLYENITNKPCNCKLGEWHKDKNKILKSKQL